MSLAPLLHAAPIIQVHAFAAMAAAVLGAVQLVRRKGGQGHRRTGYAFALAMMVTALSSLFIYTIKVWGPFSPIHILSVLTPIGLGAAIYAARRGDYASHKRGMIMLYVMALLITGLFTLWPGRIMHAVVFG